MSVDCDGGTYPAACAEEEASLRKGLSSPLFPPHKGRIVCPPPWPRFCVARTETDCASGWATIKTGEINAVLSKEEIDAFVQNPKKGTSKQCLMA